MWVIPVNLLELKSNFKKIVNQKETGPLDKDFYLIKLMNEMKKQFHIPVFPKRKYILENEEALNLYNEINSFRTDLYKKK